MEYYTSVNEHTGDIIKSRNSKAYEDNYERTFGKKECSWCGKKIPKGQEEQYEGDFFHEGCLDMMLAGDCEE